MPQPDQAQQQQYQGFPQGFQQPANMPNINFSAPVIRLGTSGQSGREPYAREERGGRRPGLGADRDERGGRPTGREALQHMVPPTKEDIIRTIFIGGITEGCGGDEGIKKILDCAGTLRNWLRATDADDKPCKFGFAMYDDAQSLHTAIEILKDVEVPVKMQVPKEQNGDVKKEPRVKKEDEDEAQEEDEEAPVEMSRLLIVIDENSVDYVQRWEESIGPQDPVQSQFRLDKARQDLEVVLSRLTYPMQAMQKHMHSSIDRDGDAMMNGENGDAEVITIPITADDELSDIPAEMRETVAKEITAFRDRSNRRDLERLRREEEIESMERARNANGPRPSRLESPTPGGGANSIPVGPRRDGPANAPAGPKGFGQQIPRDYQKGVAFVNGSGLNGLSISHSDDDDSASDSEIEQRKKAKKAEKEEKEYLDAERKWLNRERYRTAAVEREKRRDQAEEGRLQEEKDAVSARLKAWNDDLEASRRIEEYYADRSLWLRNRNAFRAREAALDDADRAEEARERARENRQNERAGAMADDFLDRTGQEIGDRTPTSSAAAAPRGPAPAKFTLSLGAAAAQKAQQQAAASAQAKKAISAEVEGLLEDEEEDETENPRKLIPIQFDPSSINASMTDEERAQAQRQLAQEIPSDREGLWAWDVRWDHVDEGMIKEHLRPFVEKKIVEYLGVQEEMVVDLVVDHLRKRGGPGPLVEELEGVGHNFPKLICMC